MARYENSEYMDLLWDGKPDACYIKGHVSHEEGIQTLREEGAIYDDTIIGSAQHIYGRWSIESWDGGDSHHVLREYNTKGRGRFKITAFGLGIFAKQPLKTHNP